MTSWHSPGTRFVRASALLGPELQLAHRNLDGMSDDDLRSLIADLEEISERTESPS